MIDNNLDIYSLKKDGSKKRVCAYCRVSTNLEDQKNSLENQKSYFDTIINSQLNWENAGIYHDKGISGTMTKKRDGFMSMLNDACSGKIDLILIKNISRFSRYTKDALVCIEELKKHDVAVYFQEMNINTLDPKTETLLPMLFSVSQAEVRNTSDHVKTALLMKAKKGEVISFRDCYGFRFDSNTKKPVIIEDEANVIRKIYRMYVVENIGLKRIADKLNEENIPTKRGAKKWSAHTICGIIKNVKNVGDCEFGRTYTKDPINHVRKYNFNESDRIITKNTHEAIIDRKTFELANEKLERNGGNTKGKHKANKNLYAFSNITYCGFCGNKYFHKSSSRRNGKYKKSYWVCTEKTKNKNCNESKFIRDIDLEQAFIKSFNRIKTYDETAIDEILDDIRRSRETFDSKEEIDRLEKEIEKLSKSMDALVELKINNDINLDSYHRKKEEIENTIKTKKNSLSGLQKMKKDNSKLVNDIQKFKKELLAKKDLKKFDRKLFESMVSKVIIGKEENGIFNPYAITFVYKFLPNDSIDIKESFDTAYVCHSMQHDTPCIDNTTRFTSI